MGDAPAEEASADVPALSASAPAEGDLLASRSSEPSAVPTTTRALAFSHSTGTRHSSLPALLSAPQPPSNVSATPMIRPFNNRLITSDVTAQALAAAMTTESLRAQNPPAMRALRLTRRHSAREEASQMSSREESSATKVMGLSSHSNTPRTTHESDTPIKRSLDAEEGVQHLRAKAAAMLLDKIKANRMGVKRMALTSGVTPASFFTAAVLAITAANSGGDDGDLLTEQNQESARGEQYEMMERFQLRRLQRTLSNISTSTDGQSEAVVGAKSSRVIPMPNPSDEEGSGDVMSVVGSSPAASDGTVASSAQYALSITAATVSASAAASNKPVQATTYDPATVRSLLNLPTERGRGPQTYRDTIGAVSMYEAYTARGVGGDSRSRWHSRMRRIRRRLVHRLSTPLSPYSWAFAVRSAIILAACSVQIVYNPYQIAFYGERTAAYTAVMAALEALFFVDFALTFNTSIINKRGTLVSSRPEIAYRYMSTWGIPHFFASFPLSSILYATTGEEDAQIRWVQFVHMLYDCSIRMQQVVQILQLYHRVGKLHVGRSSKSIWGWLLYSRYSHLMRLTWLLVAILLIAHYLACAWKMLQLPTSPTDVSDHVAFEEYAACFYGAMQLLEGQGLDTETLAQNAFSSIAVLFGSVVLAIIYGHVTMLVSNFNANSTGYQRKMEVVFAIMGKMQLPASLRERIHQYYQHLWREYESLDGEVVKFSKDLTHNLALEVSLFKYMELTMHVPFWRMCSPDFQKQLVLSLQVRVYLPDDFVMRRGEVSDEFYMINRGVCEIVRGKDSFEHCTAPLRPRRRKSANLQVIQPTGTQWGTSKPSVKGDLRRHSDVAAASTDTNNRVSDIETPHSTKQPSNAPAMIDDTRRHGQSVPGTDAASTRLGRGQAFGEAALLLNYPRTANARAVTYVEMCILNRDAFQSMLARHPDDRKYVMEQMLTWLMGNNEFHHVTCPLKQLVREVFGETEPGGATDINAASAARFLAAVTDPLVEADTAVLFGTGLEQQLSSLQVKELAARPRHTTERVPLFSSDSSHSSACCCDCCSTFPTAGPEREIESKASSSASSAVPVGLTTGSASRPVNARRAESANRTLLDFSLDSTNLSQARTIQLVGKICGSVGAMRLVKTTSASASAPPLASKIEPMPQLLSAAAYGRRRLSITPKRSASSPLFVDQAPLIQEEVPEFPSAAAVDIGQPIDGSSFPSTPAKFRTSRPRRDSVGITRGPLLRQMTSLIGFSRSGPAATMVVESPTRLADQLFQHNDPVSPAGALKRVGTFHSLSLMRPNG